jgi:hypothetical protein
MKFRNFLYFWWVIFTLLDPDSGSGSIDLMESVSNLDPEPETLIPFMVDSVGNFSERATPHPEYSFKTEYYLIAGKCYSFPIQCIL